MQKLSISYSDKIQTWSHLGTYRHFFTKMMSRQHSSVLEFASWILKIAMFFADQQEIQQALLNFPFKIEIPPKFNSLYKILTDDQGFA